MLIRNYKGDLKELKIQKYKNGQEYSKLWKEKYNIKFAKMKVVSEIISYIKSDKKSVESFF